MKLDDVDAFATSLPDVTTGARWAHHTWFVNGHGFLWVRPLGKRDLERLGDAKPPTGEIVGVIVESLDAKDALLAMELPGFFTIEHFNSYAGILIELRLARVKDVRAAIRDAWTVASQRKPKQSKKPTKPRAPRKKRR